MATKHIISAEAMLDFGAELASKAKPGDVIFLKGDLGAGKTTLARGFLRALGFLGKVKSPTYTFVETYELSSVNVVHCDLYRLQEPEALDYIGLSDYLNKDAISLIEWPEKALPLLPKPSCVCQIHIDGEAREVTYDF